MSMTSEPLRQTAKPYESTPMIGRRLYASRVWDSVGYRPHSGQVLVHRDETRNKVVSGGRRLGKSRIGGQELVAEAFKTKQFLNQLEESNNRREFWIVGPEYSDSEKEFRDLYNTLSKQGAPFDRPGTYYNANATEMQLSMFGGKFMCIGKSARYPERLVGEGLSGVVMAEAAKLKESTWSKFVRPTLADFQAWAMFTSTPEGKNWFYDLWVDGQDPSNPNWQSWRLPSWMNPVVYRRTKGNTEDVARTVRDIGTLRAALQEGGFEWNKLVEKLGINPEIASMVRDLGEIEFNQEVGADFSQYIGRVFADFDEEVHVGDFQLDSKRPCWAAADYGFTNPFVWLLLQEDISGNVVILDEIYEPGLIEDEIVELIRERGLAPANLAGFCGDPADPQLTTSLSSKLRVRGIGGGDTGGELKERLRLIRNLLKVQNKHLPMDDKNRRPRLMIDRKCRRTISDFDAYRYPDRGGETPEKKDDHAPEAFGRWCKYRFGPAMDGGRARVTTARTGRRK